MISGCGPKWRDIKERNSQRSFTSSVLNIPQSIFTPRSQVVPKIPRFSNKHQYSKIFLLDMGNEKVVQVLQSVHRMNGIEQKLCCQEHFSGFQYLIQKAPKSPCFKLRIYDPCSCAKHTPREPSISVIPQSYVCLFPSVIQKAVSLY